MPKLIQILGSVIVVFFHSLPIVVSAVIYIALLITVKKIKQEKEHQIQVENVQSGIANEFCSQAIDQISESVKENSVSFQIIQNSSVHSSCINNIRSITDQPELLINTITSTNNENLQAVKTRVNCIVDSDFFQMEQNMLSRPNTTTPISNRCNSNSIATKLENPITNINSDSTTLRKKTKEESERAAALRSMKTNLLMLVLFVVYGFFSFVPTLKWKIFLFALFESMLKCMMPIVTTLSNFGPVKNVAKMYFNLIKYQLPDISNN